MQGGAHQRQQPASLPAAAPSGPPALDAATQAAVLAFWTAEGALKPAGDVQPHRQTRQ